MKKSAFTLVELIIVITILAILRTIGFMSFQSYTADARDGKRVSDLGEIRNGLEIYQTKNQILPYPDAQVATITSASGDLSYQGYASGTILKTIRMTSDVKDSKDNIAYTYTINSSKTKYQLLAFIENKDTVKLSYNPVFSQAYAANDYTNRYTYTIGNKVGVMLNNTTNAPIQESTGTINLSTDSTTYKVVFANSTTNSGVISASGTNLATQIQTIANTTANISNPGDTQAPTGGNFTIPATTSSTGVTLTITCPTDVAGNTPIQMYVSGTGLAIGGNIWETCTTSKNITLTTGDGSKNITMKWKDSVGNESGLVINSTSLSSIYTSCNDAYIKGINIDGYYNIDPDGVGGNTYFVTHCIMSKYGGGWTLIQSFDSSNERSEYMGELNKNNLATGLRGKISDSDINLILSSTDPIYYVIDETHNTETFTRGVTGTLYSSCKSGNAYCNNIGVSGDDKFLSRKMYSGYPLNDSTNLLGTHSSWSHCSGVPLWHGISDGSPYSTTNNCHGGKGGGDEGMGTRATNISGKIYIR